MATNPLQKYFRQPKIYIKLPSMGAYSKPGVITGDANNLPVFGMTGMDEIIIKTPDALITGESTVKVIESCCPSINDAWQLNNLDLDLMLAAIRIATYGNTITMSHTCQFCSTDNEYELDLSRLIDHYNHISFEDSAVLKDLVVKLQPLTYKQTTEFGQKNFQLRQQLNQANTIENEEERNKEVSRLYVEFSKLQIEVYSANINAIEVGTTVVNERAFIDEWIANADKEIVDQLRKFIDKNTELWKTPPQLVKCESCGEENTLSIELDHSSFFATA
jgi:hypothetical protein